MVCPTCRKIFKTTKIKTPDGDDGVRVKNERLTSRNLINWVKIRDLVMKHKIGSDINGG